MIRRTLKRITAVTMSIIFCLSLTGCGEKNSTDTSKQVTLDPKNPTVITVWHYYNGSQKSAFDNLVEEFNDTVGKEKGIIVNSKNQGSVSDLETAVIASVNKKIGSEDVPNIFASYADTAYTIKNMDMLADLSQYLTTDEIDQYVDSYIEEGRIGENGELMIFPVAKSTEIIMINKNTWEEFAGETGASIDGFKTKEGIVKLAEEYYNWTDAKTPDIPNDGLAFYGRDSISNYFVNGAMQLGCEMFKATNGKVEYNLDKTVLKKIWENYYVPMVKGYFYAKGRFRSDDMKVGMLIAYTGSSSSATYFPDNVETDEGSQKIESIVLPDAVFEGGTQYSTQQGAGMVVTKSTKEAEYASVEFLKWFTESERNTSFACQSGYMPVKKDANSTAVLDKVIADNNIKINEKVYNTLIVSMNIATNNKLYTYKAFEQGTSVRSVLDYNLSDKAAADRQIVIERLNNGASLSQAVEDLIDDAQFEAWYNEFVTTIKSK